jgi:hypothetical protein
MRKKRRNPQVLSAAPTAVTSAHDPRKACADEPCRLGADRHLVGDVIMDNEWEVVPIETPATIRIDT